jgi:AcrR family transcriptional regulator
MGDGVTAGQGRRVRRGSAAGLLKDAAREVFAELGYGATTREIAARAGVSHELIFRYFDSKEKLFFEAVVSPLLDAIDGMRTSWLDHPHFTTISHEQMIRRFTVGLYEFMSANQAIARAMVHLFAGGSTEGELERLRERVSATLAPIVAPTDEYLGAQGLRHSHPALQLRLMMLFVGGAAAFLRNTYRTDDEVPSSDVIVDELSRFMSNGLRDE